MALTRFNMSLSVLFKGIARAMPFLLRHNKEGAFTLG